MMDGLTFVNIYIGFLQIKYKNPNVTAIFGCKEFCRNSLSLQPINKKRNAAVTL